MDNIYTIFRVRRFAIRVSKKRESGTLLFNSDSYIQLCKNIYVFLTLSTVTNAEIIGHRQWCSLLLGTHKRTLIHSPELTFLLTSVFLQIWFMFLLLRRFFFLGTFLSSYKPVLLSQQPKIIFDSIHALALDELRRAKTNP